MLEFALKEWAVICQALADGRQALLLRKGGIAESSDGFRLEHSRFWLLPTYTHQQHQGVQADARPLLTAVEAIRPPQGMIRLTHFAEAIGVYEVHWLAAALLLQDLHIWSEETVRSRFAYRTPGLAVIPVRVYRAAQAFELPDEPEYAGCKSWVKLRGSQPTAGATPVMDDSAMRELMLTLDRRLNPTAIV